MKKPDISTVQRMQAIRWLIDHRRAGVPIASLVSLLRQVLAADRGTVALLDELELKLQAQSPAHDASEVVEVPPTGNQAWGFWGTMLRGGVEPSRAWPLAIRALVKTTGESAQAAQAFLDSPMGRQFADAVLDGVARCGSLGLAVDRVAAEWMSKPVDPLTRSAHRMASDTPYLVGWVRIAHHRSTS